MDILQAIAAHRKELIVFFLCALSGIGTVYAQQNGVDGPINWDITGGVLTISGNGDMPDYDATRPAPWAEHVDEITSIEIDNGVTSIGASAFNFFTKLTSITIPASVTSIGNFAFYRSGLLSIIIPESVTFVGYLVFGGCTAMTSISVAAGNTEYSSENGVLFNSDKTTLVAFPSGITNIYVIPESVEIIGPGSFWENQLAVVILPSSLLSISENSFRLSENLVSIFIPSSVESIGDYAFLDCFALTNVIIPASVKNIGRGIFNGCKQLSNIVNAGRTPQILPHAIFNETDVFHNTCTLWVPPASVNAYKTATEWKEFKNIFSGISLDKEEIYLFPGATETLTATIHTPLINVFSTASVWTIENKPSVVTWTIFSPTFSQVTAVGQGTNKISVFVGGMMEATCTVTVIEEGTSSIEGTVRYDGEEPVTVYLYMKDPKDIEQLSLTKANPKIVGGYVLLAKTTPKANGQYSFENLPEGTYRIDVEIDGIESELSPEVNISVGETRSGINFAVFGNTIVPEPITGTDELYYAGLNIYPNPFSGLLRIEGAEGTQLRIFAADGKQVHVQTVTGFSETIHLEHLPAGLYIIGLENNGRIKTVKVIKNSCYAY